ncbi:MAG: 30S ribosomal protein S20 [Steroidobacteraceae bacterium]|nr:30S ribosomal protein S20 [Steroidobacteraceae bacterium]
MANTKSAEKAARQSEKHRARNVALRSRARSGLRKATAAIGTGDKSAATAAHREATSLVDALASKGKIHRNKAARHKSRLAARIKNMK